MTHLEMIDAVNDARTEEDHQRALARLSGWREAARHFGQGLNSCLADIHSMERFGEDRPMCCGVLLDWTPEKQTQDGGRAQKG
jgi:hypothetical protein